MHVLAMITVNEIIVGGISPISTVTVNCYIAGWLATDGATSQPCIFSINSLGSGRLSAVRVSAVIG